jgi:hypothetical protein
MPSISLGRGAFQRAGLPPVLLQNMYYEAAPTNLEDQVSFRPRPRLQRFTALPSTVGFQGLYREGGVLGGAIIAAGGGKLYKIVQQGVAGTGTVTEIGSVTGGDYMTAEGDPAACVLTLGATPYKTDGVTLSTIAMPDGVGCIAVDTLDSRYLFAAANSNVFYWTDVATYTIDALNFASAESQPDVIVSLKVVDDVLWLIGRLSLEAWRPTGDSDLPFERIEGRVFGIGCTARASVMKMNVDGLDTMCWVGTDRKVYRLDPNPVAISDFGMDERLLRVDPSLYRATTATWNGHDFYILHLPGEGTFAYDLTTGLWDRWSSYGLGLFRGAVGALGPNNQSLIGDDANGVLYELNEDAPTDDGDLVSFEFTGLLQITGAPVVCRSIELVVETGSAAGAADDPLMQLAISLDAGATWTPQADQPLRRQGERARRLLWTRLGLVRRQEGRVHRWRTTEPVVVRMARYNHGYR